MFLLLHFHVKHLKLLRKRKASFKHQFLFAWPTFYTHKQRDTQKLHLAQCRHNPTFLCRSSPIFMSKPRLLKPHFCGLGRVSVTFHCMESSFCVRHVLHCVFSPVLHLMHLSSLQPTHNLLPVSPNTQPEHSSKKHKPTPSHIPEPALSQDVYVFSRQLYIGKSRTQDCNIGFPFYY